ncbi:MAG: hypothetical protein H7245_04765 [Candidatus Saccharibacteria bacterium]|nr:hypothetical protein [Pseudorhodobacter sp.]
MQLKDQDLDLPDLGHKGNEQLDNGADQIQHHQKCPARQLGGRRRCHGREGHIGNNLDGKDGAQNRSGILSRQPQCQKANRHGDKAGANQRYEHCRVTVTKCSDLQDVQHWLF